ncbi:hypothetical protein [Los Azufres archaeal virus 1]|nr:hypothetical protein [Los Azufres archaeal virus 1]
MGGCQGVGVCGVGVEVVGVVGGCHIVIGPIVGVWIGNVALVTVGVGILMEGVVHMVIGGVGVGVLGVGVCGVGVEVVGGGVDGVGVDVLGSPRAAEELAVWLAPDSEHEGEVNCGGDTDPALHKFPLLHRLFVPSCMRY